MDIEIKNLCKSYGDQKILENFCAIFKEKHASCIMAPSGRGKTSMLNIIMGFEKADSGEITGLPEDISAVFQEDRLCEDFSAISNVKIAADKAFDVKQILDLLDELGIKHDDAGKAVKLLSGGMRRRVALARAICARADLMILDEPFTGLDDETKNKAAAAILKCNRTVIMVSHDIDDARLLNAEIIALPE